MVGAITLAVMLGACSMLSTRYLQRELVQNWNEVRQSAILAHSEKKLSASEMTAFVNADASWRKIYLRSRCLTSEQIKIPGCLPALSEEDADFLAELTDAWEAKIEAKE